MLAGPGAPIEAGQQDPEGSTQRREAVMRTKLAKMNTADQETARQGRGRQS